MAFRLLQCHAMALLAAARRANTFEIGVGRMAAACVHPLAAWHHARRIFRVLLLAGYFAAGFVAVLAALILN